MPVTALLRSEEEDFVEGVRIGRRVGSRRGWASSMKTPAHLNSPRDECLVAQGWPHSRGLCPSSVPPVPLASLQCITRRPSIASAPRSRRALAPCGHRPPRLADHGVARLPRRERCARDVRRRRLPRGSRLGTDGGCQDSRADRVLDTNTGSPILGAAAHDRGDCRIPGRQLPEAAMMGNAKSAVQGLLAREYALASGPAYPLEGLMCFDSSDWTGVLCVVRPAHLGRRPDRRLHGPRRPADVQPPHHAVGRSDLPPASDGAQLILRDVTGGSGRSTDRGRRRRPAHPIPEWERHDVRTSTSR